LHFIRSHFLSPDADPPADRPKSRVSSADTFIARYGTAEAAVAVLLQDLDAAQRTAEAHARALEENKKLVPGADKVVLAKADADELAKYRALNLVPEKITEALTERDTLKGTVAQSALERLAREAATASGLDPEAFAAHAAAKGLHIELRDTPVVEHGKTVTKKLPHVRPAADDKAQLVALSEYTSKLPAYDQRALQAVAGTPAPTGTAWPSGQQPTPITGSPSGAVNTYLDKRFAPKQTAGAAS
jgi:hypothetical protein